MLTGDKLETAENIGKSCKLIQNNMKVLKITETKKDKLESQIFDDVYLKYNECIKNNKKKSLIIEGEALASVLHN